MAGKITMTVVVRPRRDEFPDKGTSNESRMEPAMKTLLVLTGIATALLAAIRNRQPAERGAQAAKDSDR
jgi:hypothetical protein